MVFLLLISRPGATVFPLLLAVVLSVCLLHLTAAGQLQSVIPEGPQLCTNIARELSGTRFENGSKNNETNDMIAEFLALNFNPQRYYGGCFSAPHESIPTNASIRNGASESLKSALKAFGLSMDKKHFPPATSLKDLYNQATSLTKDLSFALFQWAEWDLLTDALANGSLAVVAFQSANETPVDEYINDISNTRYALVSGSDSQYIYLTDPRSATLRRIDRRVFFFERWKSRDNVYGNSGICARCGLLVGRGETVRGQKFLQRRSSCPGAEALP